MLFIEEIRADIPDEFFNSVINYNIGTEAGGDIYARSTNGTMLPFSSGVTYFAPNVFGEIDLPTCHHSVRSWRVVSSGAVRMPQVCLISSPLLARSPRAEVIPTRVQGMRIAGTEQVNQNLPPWASASTSTSDSGWVDLHRLVREHPLEIYFVVVQYTLFHPVRGSNLSGIIAKMSTPDVLFKIGNFWVCFDGDLGLPAVLEVDWTVL